jgi:regulator of cell morphogenesis and NO signaling
MKAIDEKTTIGEIVASDFRTATVFNAHGIDFCCKGKRTLEDVCREQQLDTSLLFRELKLVEQTMDREPHFDEWDLAKLIDFIEEKHHKYVKTHVPVIREFLEKLCTVHGTDHPELLEVRDLFQIGSENLLSHMLKEEHILFPMVRKMIMGLNADESISKPGFSVVMPIHIMLREHEAEGDRFARIKEVTSSYTVPEDGCATYRAAFSLLKQFEEDLHHHIHLENNILFPKAIALEGAA